MFGAVQKLRFAFGKRLKNTSFLQRMDSRKPPETPEAKAKVPGRIAWRMPRFQLYFTLLLVFVLLRCSSAATGLDAFCNFAANCAVSNIGKKTRTIAKNFMVTFFDVVALCAV